MKEEDKKEGIRLKEGVIDFIDVYSKVNEVLERFKNPDGSTPKLVIWSGCAFTWHNIVDKLMYQSEIDPISSNDIDFVILGFDESRIPEFSSLLQEEFKDSIIASKLGIGPDTEVQKKHGLYNTPFDVKAINTDDDQQSIEIFFGIGYKFKFPWENEKKSGHFAFFDPEKTGIVNHRINGKDVYVVDKLSLAVLRSAFKRDRSTGKNDQEQFNQLIQGEVDRLLFNHFDNPLRFSISVLELVKHASEMLPGIEPQFANMLYSKVLGDVEKLIDSNSVKNEYSKKSLQIIKTVTNVFLIASSTKVYDIVEYSFHNQINHCYESLKLLNQFVGIKYFREKSLVESFPFVLYALILDHVDIESNPVIESLFPNTLDFSKTLTLLSAFKVKSYNNGQNLAPAGFLLTDRLRILIELQKQDISKGAENQEIFNAHQLLVICWVDLHNVLFPDNSQGLRLLSEAMRRNDFGDVQWIENVMISPASVEIGNQMVFLASIVDLLFTASGNNKTQTKIYTQDIALLDTAEDLYNVIHGIKELNNPKHIDEIIRLLEAKIRNWRENATLNSQTIKLSASLSLDGESGPIDLGMFVRVWVAHFASNIYGMVTPR